MSVRFSVHPSCVPNQNCMGGGGLVVYVPAWHEKLCVYTTDTLDQHLMRWHVTDDDGGSLGLVLGEGVMSAEHAAILLAPDVDCDCGRCSKCPLVAKVEGTEEPDRFGAMRTRWAGALRRVLRDAARDVGT